MKEEFIIMKKSEYGVHVRYTNEAFVRVEAEKFAVEEDDQFVVVKVLGKVKPKSVKWDNSYEIF